MNTLKRITNQSDFDVSYLKLEARNSMNCGSVPSNTPRELNIWFPWVDSKTDLMNRAIVLEIIGITRFYIWESQDSHWYYESSKYLDGPFSVKSEVRMDGNEYSHGILVPGDSKKSHKEIEIRNYGNDIKLEFFKV